MADHAHSHEGFDVQVERTDEGTAKVSFTVSAEEFNQTVSVGLKNMASQTKMKGFRPGKVPAAMLESRFGEKVRQDAVQHFLNHAYDDAVKKHELTPAAHPRVDVSEVVVGKGEGFSFDFEVFLRPTFTLGEYKGLEIASQPVSVTDEDIDAAILDLRRQLSRPEPAGDDGLGADGMALCKLEFLMEGRDDPLLERDNIRLSPKTPPGGIDAEAFEEKLTGTKDGEAIDLTLTFPEEFPDEEARGKEGICRVTVNQAFQIIPPTKEELFEKLEVEDEAGMKEKAREGIRDAKEQQEQQRIESELIDQVIGMHEMTLPAGYLAQQVEAKAHETRHNLISSGMTEEAAETQVQEQMEEFRSSTDKALRAVYLMEEIAKREEMVVTKEEMSDEMASIAARNEADVEEVRKYYLENQMVSQLALELLERKIRTFLRESADIRGESA